MLLQRLAVFLLLGLLTSINSRLPAQSNQEKIAAFSQEKVLRQAIQLISSNKNDSALICLQPIADQLAAQGLTDSPFGLEVQLAKGQALEQKYRNSEAMTLYLGVSDKSQALGQWATYAKANLDLARLYEKMYWAEECRNSLETARSTITRFQLDSLYPRLYIRYAFWHQIYGRPDSLRFYSENALSANTKVDNPIVKYSLAVLKGNMLSEKDFYASLESYKEAVGIAKSLKDYSRLSFILHVITLRYWFHYDYPNALVYNDSTIQASYQAIQAGDQDNPTLHQAYQIRASLFNKKGQLDSAFYYAEKGFSQEVQFVKQQEFARASEINARFKDEKKSLQIQQLTEALQLEKRIRILMGFIAFLTLGFGSILTYYYFQLRRLNAKTKEQAAQLRSLDLAKSRFFANVSHELRTPLTLMLGPIKTLLKGRHSPEKQDLMLDIALKNGRQLQHLVNEILDLQKLEMGKMELQLQPTQLAPFFKRYASQFESLKAVGQIDFKYEVAVEKEVAAMIDREKFRQVIYNLLSNAFKFTPDGEHITAKLSLEDNFLTLEVADTGIGIAPLDLPRVFDRFFQNSRPDLPAQGGTGIGLALCKEYLQLFGGNITVESPGPDGKGSVFRAGFPIILTEPPKEEAQLPEITAEAPPWQSLENTTSPAGDPRPTILVVEDNPDLQTYLRVVLEEKYQVITAGNGKEALQCLEDTPHCRLILSDLMMPVMDGFQLLEKLKQADATRHIPVIMLTARADVSDKLKALRIGVDDYLLKPFNEEELSARIENLLAHRASWEKWSPEEEEPKDSTVFSARDQEWLENFEAYVKDNISQDILTVSFLAQEFNMSESTLFRQVTRLTGMSPKQYLQEVRLTVARSYLENRDFRTVSQVSEKVGYTNPRTFTRNFAERFGKSPVSYLS